MSERNSIERVSSWSRDSVGLKIVVIGVIVLVLLIPSFMIRSLIGERQARRDSATEEVGAQWASLQKVAGPILTIPFLVPFTDSSGHTTTTMRYARFLPDELVIGSDITSETRYRGMFDVLVYTTRLSFAGSFAAPSFAEWSLPADQILWNDATVSFLITDLRGLREYPTLTWNQAKLTTRPSTGPGGGVLTGIHAPVDITPGAGGEGPIAFTATIDLRGSRGLYFEPLGKETRATVAANWNSPSFQGAFLPDERTITADGFSAGWKVLDLNRSYPQAWRGDLDRVRDSGFGVDLIFPVDEYRQSERTAKYAGLFLVLTFVTVFLVEVVSRRRVHPFQYLLIGCALVIFFVLLLSLSEHLPFELAYLIAGGVITLLIAGYARAVLGCLRRAAAVGGIVAVLYGILFVVLQLEDFALLIGSLALVAAIATAMYVTRNIDWYDVRAGG